MTGIHFLRTLRKFFSSELQPAKRMRRHANGAKGFENMVFLEIRENPNRRPSHTKPERKGKMTDFKLLSKCISHFAISLDLRRIQLKSPTR